MRSQSRHSRRREMARGAAALEAAFVLPVAVIMLLGAMEVGRIVQVNQHLVNAAREGARVACGGSDGGTPATISVVETAVRNYLTGANLPAEAVLATEITLINNSSNAWINPSDAQPSDSFTVTLSLPSGVAYDSLFANWGIIRLLTPDQTLHVAVTWQSARDATVVVDTQLPF